MDYKEKLVEAKRLYQTANTDQRYVLESLFPELAEDGDEAVIKALIYLVATCCINQEEKNRLLTWFEKHQYTQRDIADAYLKGISDAKNELKKQGEQKPDSFCREHCKGFQETGKCFADGDCKAKREAEQKPAWGEEDENTIKVLMNIIRKSEVIDSIIYTDSLKEKLYDWLNSLKYRYIWKPSDDQMKALAWALSIAKNCGEECAFDIRKVCEQLEKLKG